MPAANQFTTAAGGGFDPDEDQRLRSLGSGVNSGQGLPNLDPLKMTNPYAGGNPYAGTRTPPAQGVSDNRQPGDQPEAGNPYRTPASAQSAAMSPVRRQAMTQAPAAAVPQQLSVSPTGTYTMNPMGQHLLAAAQGKRSPDQLAAEKVAADDQYKDAATAAAERGAAGGQLGFINDLATRAAAAGETARVQTRAEDQARARDQFLQWEQQQQAQTRAERDREQRLKEMLQQLQIAEEQQEVTRRGQDISARTAEQQRKIERERNILNALSSMIPFGKLLGG